MIKITYAPSVWVAFFLLIRSFLYAQNPVPNPNAVDIALNYITKEYQTLNLTQQDVTNVYLQDSYTTQHNGVTHVFIIQQHNGIDLYNGIINVNILPSGEVLYVGNRFIKNLASAVNSTTPQLKADDALMAVCGDLKIALTRSVLNVKNKKSDKEYLFDKADISFNDIPVKLCYHYVNDKEVRLAWNVVLGGVKGQDTWSMHVDALSGVILEKTNLTIKCTFNEHAYKHIHDDCEYEAAINFNKNEKIVPPSVVNAPPVAGNSYNVFALPIESPNHGNRSVVTDPADPLASPFGWHDTNGQAGPEFTITRGNNTHAYLDLNNTNVSSNNEPNGGNDLIFDAPFSPTAEPAANRNAAVINLFYMNNMLHDITFRYGFDETAGNYQFKNYTNAPGANDPVIANAQDGASLAASQDTRNNARFTLAPDGSSGKIEMYTWTRTGEKLLHVTAPENAKIDIATGTGNFGQQIGTTPISGDVVLVNDGTSQPTLGCNAPVNNVSGKIVLIDRGVCEFGRKALNVQQKGAIAVIIANFEENLIAMGGGAVGSQVTIPVLNIKKSDADRLKLFLKDGLKISLYRDEAVSGPELIDGDFDNGIISHEYGHGVSSRLTGGRQNVTCLSSGEQASAEGWSDFLALVVTTKPSDRGTTPRGVGTYVYRQPTNGPGVRRNVYTIDLTSTPNTYDDIIRDTFVHAVGEIWVSPLWDLYWMFVDLYGFDPNLRNTNSGNGKMLKLAIDCMKIQPCNPGFLDGRDALIAADKANFGGQHECMIWSAFARRGMGFNALQGSPQWKFDNKEGFETKPQCIQKIKITKAATESINAGENITYTITVTNHKAEAATGVVVTDEIPTGTTFLNGSANQNVSVANNILTWNIGNLAKDATATLTYKVVTPADKKSIAQFIDDFEAGDNNWDLEDLNGTGNIWELTDSLKRSGKKAFRLNYANMTKKSDQTFKNLNPINIKGSKPILRFYHRISSQPAIDAGAIEISTDNGFTWVSADEKIFKNPYTGEVAYSTFVVPNAKGFWGNINSFIPVCVDLSSYIGKNIKFRFRFAADDEKNNFKGWYIDDIAVMDMVNYNSKARVISAQKDTATAEVPERGTIVEPFALTPTTDLANDLNFKVYPNPTHDILNIHISGTELSTANLSIYATDGRLMWSQKLNNLNSAKESLIPVDISSYASGIYFTKIQTESKVLIEKVIKN